MDILYMGYFCNEDLFNELVEKGSNGSHARQQFEKKLLYGITQNSERYSLKLRSYLPLVDEKLSEIRRENYEGLCIEYLWCKKSMLSMWRGLISNINFIKDWAADGNEKKIILTYSANPLHCVPAILLRRKYGYKIVTITSEISTYRKKFGNGLFFDFKKKISCFLENKFDGYILLSKYMNEIINNKNKPYLVMEGFAEITVHSTEIHALKTKPRVLFYAGGLSEENGIKILIEGFKISLCDDMELWLCGEGDLKEYVIEQAQMDNRIKYWGVLSNKKVKELEYQSCYLINPRFSNEDYTKYSFPSKTLEYMSTGVPTIITRLKGIPEEYFKYVIILEDESIEGIKLLLEKIKKVPYKECCSMGEEAKKFVFENKSPAFQGKRILSFLSDLSGE